MLSCDLSTASQYLVINRTSFRALLGSSVSSRDSLALPKTSSNLSRSRSQDKPLFSGLNLGPGSYYLTLVGVSGTGYWQYSNGGSVSPGTGVTVPATAPDTYIGNPIAAYAPASIFSQDTDPSAQGVFDVTGTANAVPEPSTLALLGSGLVCLVGVSRRRLPRFAASCSCWVTAPSNNSLYSPGGPQ